MQALEENLFIDTLDVIPAGLRGKFLFQAICIN